MSALVVVESMWGNTREVGEAVARGLGEEVSVVDVSQAPTTILDDVDLLVVGGPTHAFSMSREKTRQSAAENGAAAERVPQGIREWLEAMPSSDHLDVATFDTRVAKVKHLPGSAARSAGKEVRRHHLGRLVASKSFYVEDMKGPIHEGELDRAEAWGADLAAGRRESSRVEPAARPALRFRSPRGTHLDRPRRALGDTGATTLAVVEKRTPSSSASRTSSSGRASASACGGRPMSIPLVQRCS